MPMFKRFFFFTFILLNSTLCLFGQDSIRKVEKVYTPQKGDWGLSTDIVPFLNYAGQLITEKDFATIKNNIPLTIAARYFVYDNKAYRMQARIGVKSEKYRNSVISNTTTTADTPYVQDTKKINENNFVIIMGIEKRRGKGRVQGIYGIEGVVSLTNGNTQYAYGNTYSSANISVYTTDFSAATETGFQTGLRENRITQVKNGSTTGVGARAFLGAEYFLAAKFSMGIEFGWGLLFTNTNDGYIRQESWDVSNSAIKTKTTVKSGGTAFGIDNYNSGGKFLLNFYF